MKPSCLLVSLGLVAAATAPAQIFRYDFVDLGTVFGGTATNATAINDSGTIVLNDRILTGTTVTPMPGLATGRNLSGVAINAIGQVVGNGRTGTAASTQRAGRYDPATTTTTNLGGINERSEARAINASGVIVGAGRSTSTSSTQRALRWNLDGTITNLASGLPAVESIAYGIDASGRVVGQGRTTGATTSLPLLFDGTGGATALPLLSGTDRGEARAINDNGFVAGRTSGQTFDTARAALWNLSDNSVTELLKPDASWGGMTTVALNGDNVVVGTGVINGITTLGVVWQNNQGFRLDDLTDNVPTGYDIRLANDINESGQIVGYARLDNGDGTFVDKAFLLNPYPVPEPASMAVLGLGLAALRRRRKG